VETKSNGESKGGGIFNALLRSLAGLLRAQVQLAQQEASNDVGRVLAGIVLMLAGGFFATVGVLGGHVALVYYLQQQPFFGDWLPAVLAVASVDLILALLFVVWGRSRLRQPVLKRTRAAFREMAGVAASISER